MVVQELLYPPPQASEWLTVGGQHKVGLELADLSQRREEAPERIADDIRNYTSIDVACPELCPRYSARLIRGLPQWFEVGMVEGIVEGKVRLNPNRPPCSR